jgi:hypothetical protein
VADQKLTREAVDMWEPTPDTVVLVVSIASFVVVGVWSMSRRTAVNFNRMDHVDSTDHFERRNPFYRLDRDDQ